MLPWQNKKFVGRWESSRKLFIGLNIHGEPRPLNPTIYPPHTHTHTPQFILRAALIEGYHDSEENMRAHMPLCVNWVLAEQIKLKS